MAYVNLGQVMYPVGSVYHSFNTTSPASIFGGSWSALNNQFLLSSNGNINTTGGEWNHTLNTNEMPNHTHQVYYTLAGTNLSLPSNQGNWQVLDAKWGWQPDRTPIVTSGGGLHTTICRLMLLVVFGKEQLKPLSLEGGLI